jgi:hypothetical protein
MSPYQELAELLPPDLSAVERERRVSTAAALFRQAIFTLECQGMPGPLVVAIANHVIASENTSRASQGAR